LLMVWIFMLAGAFAASAKGMGAVEATVNLTLTFLPANYALAGLFFSACVVSLCMGTGIGTIIALMPIASLLAERTEISLPIMAAAVIGGAFFGDNLSFISDTTIVATQSQGCKLSDKFRFNIRMVLPMAIIVGIIYIFLGRDATPAVEEIGQVLWWKTIPYLVVLVCAAAGMNVLIVLLIANVLIGLVGLLDGSFAFMAWVNSMIEGINGMGELILISMLAGGIFALIKHNGWMDALIRLIQKHTHTQRGAELSICGIVATANIITANNTVAILSVGAIAKRIANHFGIDPRRSASLLDTTSCTVQGLLPYGAHILLTAGIIGMSPFDIIPYLFYPMLIGVAVLITIVVPDKWTRRKRGNSATVSVDN
ncbi:MAG: Na+/H+ antiporter NhaC family protein, partial [Paludibacteraceae bacterium]|nr:Na+/H+ antiporter NhaC family protein [Paludibacteraceae bacterium]